jgi:hypothetical protein
MPFGEKIALRFGYFAQGIGRGQPTDELRGKIVPT